MLISKDDMRKFDLCFFQLAAKLTHVETTEDLKLAETILEK